MEHTKPRQVTKVRELKPLNFNDKRLKYYEVKQIRKLVSLLGNCGVLSVESRSN